MFERHHLQTLIKRMHEPRRFLQVVMGPRQVGKTTLITQLIVQAKIDYLFGSADSVACQQCNLAGTAMGGCPYKTGTA